MKTTIILAALLLTGCATVKDDHDFGDDAFWFRAVLEVIAK